MIAIILATYGCSSRINFVRSHSTLYITLNDSSRSIRWLQSINVPLITLVIDLRSPILIHEGICSLIHFDGCRVVRPTWCAEHSQRILRVWGGSKGEPVNWSLSVVAQKAFPIYSVRWLLTRAAEKSPLNVGILVEVNVHSESSHINCSRYQSRFVSRVSHMVSISACSVSPAQLFWV